MHRSHIFLYFLLAFIGGIFLGSFFLISQRAAWMAIIVCLISIIVFFRRDSKTLNLKFAFFAFLALFFIFGIIRYNATYLKKHILKEFALASADIKDSTGIHKIKIDLYGYVNDETDISGGKQRLTFKSNLFQIGGKAIESDENVLIITALFPEYKYGQTLKINGELLLPQNFLDSDFDYISYLAKSGVYTLMSFPKVESVDFQLSFFEKLKIGIFEKIYTFKNIFEKSVNRSVAEPNAAYINGILLGSRSQIPADLKDAFARTSTSHILAISGFNITLIAEILALFFLLFLKRPTAFWFSIVGILLFTLLTGAQASVVRASIMGGILLLAQREGRLYGAANAIVFAGAIMILANPDILRYDAGFQLSFLATLGLVYLGPIAKEKLEKLTNFLGFRETLAMTVSAQIAVLPLLIFYFKKLSIISLPANILILPFVPLSMLLGFITGLLGMIIPILGTVAGYFAWFLTSIQLFLVRFLAKPDWAVMSISFPWYVLVIVYIAGIFSVWRFTFKKKT